MSNLAYELDDRSLAEIAGGEVDVADYERSLKSKLAINGRSILRHCGIVARAGMEFVPKIDKHLSRAPVSPDLPEVRARLANAVTEKAPEQALLELLMVYEPMLEEADKFYND